MGRYRVGFALLLALGCGRVSVDSDEPMPADAGASSSAAGRAATHHGGSGGNATGATSGGRNQGGGEIELAGTAGDSGGSAGDSAGAAGDRAGTTGDGAGAAGDSPGTSGNGAGDSAGSAGNSAGTDGTAGSAGNGSGTSGNAGTSPGAGGDTGVPLPKERILSGYARSVCSLLAGKVECWGAQYYGTLGTESYENVGDQPNELGSQLKPVNVGTGLVVQSLSVSNHACAILTSGALKCWGWNNNGELGTEDTITRGAMPGQMGDALPFVKLGVGRRAVQVSTGLGHTCALLDDQSVKCWGANGDGELGYDDTQNRGGVAGDMDKLGAVPLGRPALVVYTGLGRSCAILNDGSAKCWGYNDQGQLGYGDTRSHGGASGDMAALGSVSLGTGRWVRQVVLGWQFSCALLDDQSVKCWGRGYEGQLASGSSDAIGDQPGEMGDALPAINLGAHHALQLTAGKNHACALLDDFSVKCWGSAENGQLGNGDATQWLYIGNDPDELGDNLKPVALGSGHSATAVVAGEQSTCVVLEDLRSVKCWGNGFDGELGNGSNGTVGDQASEMGDALPLVPLE